MSDDTTVTGYEPQGARPDTSKRTKLVPAEQIEVQVNIQMPNGLKWAVQDYQASLDIPTMREAFIHLIRIGLKAEADRLAQ